MRKIFILVLLTIIGYQAQSQVLISLLFGDKLNSDGMEFGLEAAYSSSQITNMGSDERLNGFNLGFYFDVRLKEPWYLYTGVLVKSRLGIDELTATDLDFLGTTVYPEAGTYSQKLGYFIVPALAKYKFKNDFYLEAGPQFSLLNKAFVEYKSDSDDPEGRVRDYNKSLFNKFDVGFAAGMGYQLMKGKGMTLGIKYYAGFNDVYKNLSNTKNNALYIKINVPVGAPKE